MSTLTTANRVATLPRVNLLPPEIQQLRRFRRVQGALAAGVVAALGIVGALFVLANGQVSNAQDDVALNEARGAQLQNQVAEYAEVPAVHAQVDAARAQLDQAMGKEIRWSYFLNDLSLKIPSRVWLESMTVVQAVDQPSTPTTVPTQDFLTTGLGTVAFAGRAYAHNDVAAFLDSLAKQTGFAQPYFTDSTEDALGDRDHAVKFSSSVTLTDEALSKRYTQKAGS